MFFLAKFTYYFDTLKTLDKSANMKPVNGLLQDSPCIMHDLHEKRYSRNCESLFEFANKPTLLEKIAKITDALLFLYDKIFSKI